MNFVAKAIVMYFPALVMGAICVVTVTWARRYWSNLRNRPLEQTLDRLWLSLWWRSNLAALPVWVGLMILARPYEDHGGFWIIAIFVYVLALVCGWIFVLSVEWLYSKWIDLNQ